MDSRLPRLATALEFLLYAALAAIMLHATWLTWPDAYIDFSRELYLPWRVSCGDVLYRDLAYYFGPVSVYVNASLFALLGRPSIHALFALNFAFWVATLLALRALLRRIARPAVAAFAVSLFILLFSFNRYISCGSFNYLAPYSHELPRGLLLSLLSLLALDSALRRRSAALSLLSGLFLGLSLFTKPEIALAAVAATAVFFFARFLGNAPLGDAASSRVLLNPGRPARDGGANIPPPASPSVWTFALGLLLALAAVLIPFSFALGSFSQALHDTLFKLYLDCFNPALTSLPFFKDIMGTSDIPSRVLRMFFGAVLAVAPFLLARMALPRISSRPLRFASALLFALSAAAVGLLSFYFLNAVLSLAPVAFAVVVLRSSTRAPLATDPFKFPLVMAFAAFSFFLVSKMLLNASITFYGFVLVLPAFCCAVLLLFRPPCSPARAVMATLLLLGFSSTAIRHQANVLRRWDIRHPVHDGAFLTDPLDAQAFNTVLDWLRANTPPGSTLAVLPEGAVLNVLADRPNSTPYISLEEQAWPRYDEDSLLAAYSNSPPDTIVLVRKPQDADFGTGYAQSLMAILNPLYTPAFTFFGPPSMNNAPYLLVATRTPSNLPHPAVP